MIYIFLEDNSSFFINYSFESTLTTIYDQPRNYNARKQGCEVSRKAKSGRNTHKCIIYFEATRLATTASPTQRSKSRANPASSTSLVTTQCTGTKSCVSAAPQAEISKQLFDSSEMATRFAPMKPLFQWISFTLRFQQ